RVLVGRVADDEGHAPVGLRLLRAGKDRADRCHQMDRKAHDALSPEHQQTKQATLALTTTRRVLTRPRPPRVWRPPGLLLHPTSVADRLGVVILADRHGA